MGKSRRRDSCSSPASGINICIVCGIIKKDVRWIRHFGVKSVCFSCGLFFSRSLAREYKCVDPQICKKRQENIKSSLFGRVDENLRPCPSCRMQRCLQVGMRPTLARVSRIKDENKKQKMLPILSQYSRTNANAEDPSLAQIQMKGLSDARFLESLLYVEDKFELIFNAEISFPKAICEQIFEFSDFKEFLRGSNQWNLLESLANGQKSELKQSNREGSNWKRYLEQCSQMNRKHYEFFLAQDMGLFMELAKTMPFYHLLDFEDRLLVVSKVSLPALLLCRAFYMVQQREDSIRIPGEERPLIALFHQQKYLGDQQVKKLAGEAYVLPIDTVRELLLCRDEMVILRAILITNFLTTGLSAKAQQLLQAETERYSQLLLRLLQLRHGTLSGARKYSDALRLIPRAFRSADSLRQLFLYNTIFYGNVPQINAMKEFI